jgi:hypothetical protein
MHDRITNFTRSEEMPRHAFQRARIRVCLGNIPVRITRLWSANSSPADSRNHGFLGVCLAVCFLVTPAAAAPQSSIGQGFGITYDRSQEVALIATFQGFDTHPAPGSPVGLHLLISASGNTIDAHLGPYLSKENLAVLHSGQLVQVIGVNRQVHGKTMLLARRLIFNGRQVDIRNERGFLIRSDLAPHQKTILSGGGR